MTRTALAAALLLGALALGAANIAGPDASPAPAGPVVPACAEDSVLLGTGDFEAGYWTGYECGPARDDYMPTGEVGDAVIGFPGGFVVVLP